MVILTQQSMGEMSINGNSGHSVYFHFLKHFMVILKCMFFRASLLHLVTLSKTVIACVDMQLRYCKVETTMPLNL